MTQAIYFKDEDVDYFFRLALAFQTYKGSQFGECFYAAGQVREQDPETWIQAWMHEARKTEAYAQGAEARGHRVSAREAYLRSTTYTAVGAIAMRPDDPRFRASFDSLQASFRRAAALHDVPIETLAIPFEGKSLSGYFLLASSSAQRLPTILTFSDSWTELMYFLVGAAGVGRGYNVLLVDLPGTGGTPFEGLYLRPDSEVPIRIIVDYLVSRNDVDRSRIAIWGQAMGGYHAMRAVADEMRISACVADTPLYDMGAVLAAEAAVSSASLSPGENRFRSIVFALTSWMAGESDLSKILETYKRMKVDDLGRITCPVLCLAGRGEVAERIRQTNEVYQALSHPKKAIHIFETEEGAEDHNQIDNLSRLHQVAFDWLDEVLTRYPSR
jgi:pimeloyl-ACP methyl ester carboxylesterase